MPKQRTHDEYIAILKERHGDRITCLGVYAGSDTAIEHLCHTCGQSWLAVPNNLTRKRASGCRLCAETRITRVKKSPDVYEQEVRAIHGTTIVVCDPYQARKKPLRHGCTTCDHEWMVLPANVLNGNGCPKCNNERKVERLRTITPIKTHSEYVRELNAVHLHTIIPLDRYTLQAEPTRHLCVPCQHVWSPRPYKLLEGRGCPSCQQSKGEKYIRNWFRLHDCYYIAEHSFDDLRHQNKLRFDFYLPNDNLLIEYDGQQHFEPVAYFDGDIGFKRIKHNDALKDKYAKQNGIRLVRIPYWLTHEDIDRTLREALSESKTRSSVNTLAILS